MSYANVRRGRLRKHLRWLPVTLAHATLPHRSCVSRAVRKGRPLCFTPRAPAGAYVAATLRAHENSTSAANRRQADRARTPRTALPPGAAAGAPDRSTIAHRLAVAMPPHRAGGFLAAYSRSFAFAFASARHRSWRTWLPVQSGSPQTSHGRRRIGAARWRFAWRKIAERLRPNASATARYEAPETSTSSTAAASGWVQAVQGRGIPSDYTETKRPAPAAGAEVAACSRLIASPSASPAGARPTHHHGPTSTRGGPPYYHAPPARSYDWGGASPSARRVKLGSSCTPMHARLSQPADGTLPPEICGRPYPGQPAS